MTNNQLREDADKVVRAWNSSAFGGLVPDMAYKIGFKALSALITNHLKSLPLDQMTGKQVEESLWKEFLHIQ